MQGQGAEASVVAALEAIAARQEAFDAVVVIRGGGSAADLNCFNGYRLCAHIAQFPLPVLTGIGHDKDTSVADMVAHTPLKTPDGGSRMAPRQGGPCRRDARLCGAATATGRSSRHAHAGTPGSNGCAGNSRT